MTPAEHRARAELIATACSAPEWPERGAALEQLPAGLLDLGWPTMLAAGQLHALLATPFVDPDEIIEIRPIRPGSDRG